MVSGRVQVKERASNDERCPYCRDALEGDLVTAACEGCGLAAHVECWAALRRCPALGCGRDAPPAPPGALPRPEAPAPFTVGGTTTVIPPRPPPPRPPPPRPAPPPRRPRPPRPPRPVHLFSPRPGRVEQPTPPDVPVPMLVAGILAVPALLVGWGLHSVWASYHEVDLFMAGMFLVFLGPLFLLFAVPALVFLWRGLRRALR